MLGDHLVFPILLTKDLEVSRAFYHGTLGLEVAREGADRIMFRCGGGSLLTLSLSTTGTADTQTQAAQRIYATLRAWQGWEADEGMPEHRRMHVGLFELYLLKTGLKSLDEVLGQNKQPRQM